MLNKIMLGVNPIDGWVRAGKYLGLNCVPLNTNRIFDCLNSEKPDILIIDSLVKNSCLEAAVKKFKVNVCEINDYLPACDCPPNFEGGKYDEKYKCDALIVGHYKESFQKYLNILDYYDVNYKIFGSGLWHNPHYLGLIKPKNISDAYKTAKYTLDLEGDVNTVLTILAAKGNPLSINKWNYGIQLIDSVPQITEENLILSLKKDPIENTENIPTLSDRLKELLEKLK